MAAKLFKISIGSKRQVTLPAAFTKMLSLEEGSELALQVVGDHAVLVPVVTVPRTELPEELRQKFLSRRGAKSSDIALDDFLVQMGYQQASEAPEPAARRHAQPLAASA